MEKQRERISFFKGKVRANAMKSNSVESDSKKKLRLAEYFKQRYDKPKIFEFKPIDKINMTKHFYFPKGFVILSGLTKPAIAVYPVLCSMADFETNNWIQLSRENIAKISGLTPITVDKGIEDLLKFRFENDRLLERQMETNGKEHYYMYRIGFIRRDMLQDYKSEFFIFHTCIIDSGIWSKLSSRAKALYLAIRSVAKFDPEAYAFENDIEYSEMEESIKEHYRDRECDYCLSSLAELCRMVGIGETNMNEVLEQLKYYRLVLRDHQYWKVYLKPEIRNY